MPDDLYGINLDPNSFAAQKTAEVPHAPARRPVKTAPAVESIGGSSIGADAEDDQRVRDLIEEYLKDHTTINTLNSLIIIGNPLLPCS
jgi:hypothetical protein